ncbi:EF-hand domain-containing protein D2-like [Scleropages formosus]|uniref:EF-hand domain-containing protein D2-like n=1 Tax=Scleropages formosus TaxID=113540 RepID=A0A0N8JXH3_SCLFO|nr:EF-hand domain-containing protein D2-like [Scleropages formosus]
MSVVGRTERRTCEQIGVALAAVGGNDAGVVRTNGGSPETGGGGRLCSPRHRCEEPGCKSRPGLVTELRFPSLAPLAEEPVPRSVWTPRYDAGKDNFIDLMELKLMMEKLGAPQTHIGLKNMIKEVDEDFDGKLSFREFLLIFRKAAAGELAEDSGLHALARLSEIDVSTEGVKGAKTFFEAKVQAMSESSRFEAEIRQEQEEKKRQAEERKQRQAAFRELQSAFQ